MAGPKRGCLGFSLPVIVGIAILFLAMLFVSLAGGALGRSLLGNNPVFGFLNIPQPEPELPPETIFHLFGFPITNSIISAWITVAVLVGICWAVTRAIKLIPGRGQAAFELLVGWLYNFCGNVAGEKNGRRFFPVVATIFLFVAFNAWLSLLPGFGSITVTTPEGTVPLLRGPNTDANLPLALALVSFVFVEYFGLRTLGIRYLSKFVNVGPLFRSIKQMVTGKVKEGLSGLITGFISVFVGILEFVLELVRIVSFTFRLFGNMTAGEVLLLIAAFLIPWLFAIPFYGLELFVGFVQALIFGGLTLIFMTVATAGHGSEE